MPSANPTAAHHVILFLVMQLKPTWLAEASIRLAMTRGRRRYRAGALNLGSARAGRSVKALAYLATEAWAAAIFAFTASRLKLAPFCIGGNSIAVIASFSTCCWTNTKRQNSYLNQSKYC